MVGLRISIMSGISFTDILKNKSYFVYGYARMNNEKCREKTIFTVLTRKTKTKKN